MSGNSNRSSDGLVEALARTHAAIAAETQALRANDLSNLAEHQMRKDRSLLELSRHASRLQGAPSPEAREILRDLRDAIIANQSALRIQLNAARTITERLMRAIADEDSDRTYSMPARARRT